MKLKKAVLIGAGSIGGFKPEHIENVNTGVISHGHAINRFCLPVAVIDPDPEKRNYVKNKWKFSAAVESLDFLPNKDKVDLWVIATPPETHRLVFESILPYARGKMVLLEKPAGADKQDAELIAAMAKTNRVQVFVNYQRCYLPDYQHRVLVQHIGSISEVTLHYCRGFKRDASHFFALLKLWGVVPCNSRLSTKGIPDFGKADLTFDAMADRVHICAHDGRAADVFQVEVVGGKGRVVYEDHGKLFSLYTHKREVTFGDYNSWNNVPDVVVPTGLDNGLEHVYKSILQQHPRGFTIQDALGVWNMMTNFLEAK